MRACDHTWGGYIGRILDEDHPSFRAESPRSTIRRTDVLSVPFGVSLEAFTRDRARLVGRLRAADENTLARTASVRCPAGGARNGPPPTMPIGSSSTKANTFATSSA